MKETWSSFKDGYITAGHHSTFQKGYEREELLELKLGLNKQEWVKDRSAISVIYQIEKKEENFL
jgi:hypothetical protein